MVIDYEFADWNPEMYDLANYLNELCCDNAHPGKDCCIKYYLENWPSEQEIRHFTKEYLLNRPDFQNLDEVTVGKAVSDVKKCMLL